MGWTKLNVDDRWELEEFAYRQTDAHRIKSLLSLATTGEFCPTVSQLEVELRRQRETPPQSRSTEVHHGHRGCKVDAHKRSFRPPYQSASSHAQGGHQTPKTRRMNSRSHVLPRVSAGRTGTLSDIVEVFGLPEAPPLRKRTSR